MSHAADSPTKAMPIIPASKHKSKSKTGLQKGDLLKFAALCMAITMFVFFVAACATTIYRMSHPVPSKVVVCMKEGCKTPQ